MTRQEIIDTLEHYNTWRIDVHIKQPDHVKVWEATKAAISLLKEDKKIIEFYETI